MRTALMVDYGGVLTTPVAGTLTGWMAADALDPDRCAALFRDLEARSLLDEDGPIHGLEVGTWSPAEFERAIAAELAETGLGVVQAEGLLSRMFGGLRADHAMVDLVRRAHDAGVRTALVTNYFGLPYPFQDWPGLFDASVVSAEVGLRKPDPAIYHLACETLEVPANAVVFIDDMEPNVVAADGLGMAGILHRTAVSTAAQLDVLLGIKLSEP